MSQVFTLTFLTTFSVVLLQILIEPSFSAIPNHGGPMQQNRNKVMCTANSLMIYSDCRICVCPKPNRPARCFKKTCDLRTKNGGQCPTAILKMDDDQLCPKDRITTCTTDNDCQGSALCCFDFCRGTKCVDPVPLDFGVKNHQGLGYP